MTTGSTAILNKKVLRLTIFFELARNNTSYVIAWAAIIFGAIRFFSALNNKGKFSKILRRIQEEKQETIN